MGVLEKRKSLELYLSNICGGTRASHICLNVGEETLSTAWWGKEDDVCERECGVVSLEIKERAV